MGVFFYPMKFTNKIKGPLVLHEKKARTSHSGLSEVLRIILGLPGFSGDEKFLQLGLEFHARELENKSVVKLPASDQKTVNGMLAALKKHKWYQRMKVDTKKEKELIKKIDGVKVSGWIDILKRTQYVIDLKSTTCETYDDFLQKAVSYGYFRQGIIYALLANVEDVYFVGVQKQSPHKVFVLNIRDYPLLVAEARQEVKFLLYYFKEYGFPYIQTNKKNEVQTRSTNNNKRNSTRNFSRKKRQQNYFTFKEWKKNYY